MLNPVDELRPLAQCAILGLMYAILKLVEHNFGSGTKIAFLLVAALLLPASVAILGLEGNPAKAVYPVALVRMMRGMGIQYAVVLAIAIGFMLSLVALVRLELWLPLQLAASMFCILSLFSVLAGGLYERRHELGLETWHSPERKAERVRAEMLRQDELAIDEAYGKVRVGAHTEAWTLLQAWLAARGNSAESYHWLCERVSTWVDPRYVTRLTQEYLDYLLRLRRNGEVLDVVEQRLRVDPDFRPKSASVTLQIAQLAMRGGMPQIARVLLTDFSVRYADDPSVPIADTLARDLKH